MNNPAWFLAVVFCAACGSPNGASSTPLGQKAAATGHVTHLDDTPTLGSLGAQLFFDRDLSEPAGESCGSCHDPNAGYADPRGTISSEGAVSGRFGPRNAPSIVYASYVPPLSAATDEAGYAGGLFWDGRATSLEAQAGGPLLNPLEMNNADQASVVAKIQASGYAADFQTVFGADVFADSGTAFSDAMSAIAEYERSGITNRFTSKFDAYQAGNATLSESERRGMALFDDANGANCASCHLDVLGPNGEPPLFTDFGYDNLGIPKNLANPFYDLPPPLNPDGTDYLDNGLGGSIKNPRQFGTFKAPSLRNIELTAPYGHNGYFADLTSLVKFYNTRDVASANWAPAEVDATKNTVNMGNLGLSDDDVNDIVTFMKTLTDGYTGD